MTKFYKNNFDYDKRLLNPLIDEILKIFSVGFFVLLIFVQFRALEIGYTARDISFSIVVFFVLILYYFKDRISAFAKYIYLIVLTLISSVVGVYSLGMLTGEVFFFPIIIVLLALFYSKRIVQIFTLFSIIFFIYIAYIFTTQNKMESIDINLLFVSGKHWAVYLASIFLFFVVSGIVIIKYRTTIDELILEINTQKDQVEKLANYDYLTQLATYNLLKEHYKSMSAKAKRNSTKIGIAFGDLDGFKSINDLYGHDAGDYCLRIVAARLKSTIRTSDLASRIGGDEFILLFDDITDTSVINVILEKIIENVNKPIVFEGNEFKVGISFGISIYPDNSESLDQLKKYADNAMYKVKHNTKNSFYIYKE